MKNESTIIEKAATILDFFEKRILIVDDVKVVGKVATAQLVAAGFKDVRFETDPRNVIAMIREFQPSMILLDIFMPHISGLELLKQIREEPEFDSIIVLMLSSAGADERFQSLELGAFGFIQKPITAINLVQTITKKFSIASRIGIQ